jgi:hypothetical protein
LEDDNSILSEDQTFSLANQFDENGELETSGIREDLNRTSPIISDIDVDENESGIKILN